MGWRDAPEVAPQSKPKWADAPTVDQPKSYPELSAAFQEAVTPKDKGAVHAALGGALQGMTLGFGDELMARALSLHPQIDYDKALPYIRGDMERSRSDHKVASVGGEVAGGVAGALLTPIGRLGSGAATLAGNIGRGAATGAGLGFVSGFGNSEGGADNRTKDAMWSALIGGGIGAAAPAVGAAAKHVYRSGAEALANRGMAIDMAKGLGVSPNSARVTNELLGMENPAALDDALRAAGPNAFLADASGGLEGALDAAVRTPGQASRVAMGRVDSRASGALDDIARALDDTMGKPQGIESMKAGIRESTSGARGSAYDAAFAQPINYADEAGMALEALTPRIPSKAIEYANNLMRVRGEQSAQIAASIADDGTVSFSRPPDVRQWNYVKQALDALARQGDGNGLMGGQTPLGSSYQSLAREIRDGIAAAVPEYSTALDTASDAITRVNATDFGSTLLRPGTSREAVAMALDGARKPEIDAMKLGLRSQLDEALANVKAVATDPNIDARAALKGVNDMSSKAAEEKMGALLGDQWATLKPELDKARVATGLRARMATNSRTMGRDTFNRFIDETVEPSALRRGRPLEAAKETAATAMGASKSAVNRLRADAKGELADILTRSNPAEIVAMFNETLRKRSPNAAVPENLRRLLTSALLGNSGTLGSAEGERLRKLFGPNLSSLAPQQ